MNLLSPTAYSLLARPLLFRLPPEAAQKVAETLLKRAPLWRSLAPAIRVSDGRLAAETGGLSVLNPVGLAAGFDKNCEMLPSLASLGFGYVVAGTVTENPRSGNPRPRMVRLTKQRSLLNSMGFPGKGLDHAATKLEGARDRLGDTRLVVSVSGETIDEVVRCHRRLEPMVDAVEVNISSPNTAGLRVFHEANALRGLIGAVSDGRTKPLWVKMPPFPADGPEHDRVVSLVKVCVESGVDALTVANTRPVEDSRLAVGRGGLSGAALLPDTLRIVREVASEVGQGASEVGQGASVNACGGISSGRDTYTAMEAGAASVQLYTGLVYRGPGVVRAINRELLALSTKDDAEAS